MIKLKNIYKVYENGTLAICNISLELPSNGFVAITGTSGSGKSTLLNILSNNDTVSKGQVLYKDKPYEEYKKAELTKDFAYIYQDFKLIENMTVFQNIAIGYELANENLQYDFVLQIAKKLGLENLLDQKVYALSGGQQQRVAIARALARKTKVIFADEPTGNLDSKNSDNIFALLKEISKEILVVVVSHDVDISKWANRVISLNNGKICYDQKSENNQNTTEFVAELEQNEVEENVEKIENKSSLKTQNYKSKIRKKSGLSTKSTLALTLAFNNRGIAKKVVLIAISCVLMAVIFFSLTIMMSNQIRLFFNAMKSNQVPFISYSQNSVPDDKSDFYSFLDKDYEQVNNYINEKYKAKTYVYKNAFSTLNDYIDEIEPQDNGVYNRFNKLSLQQWQAVYVDEPSEVGLKLLKGVAPKINEDGIDEIAISKTFYDYFLDAKSFVTADGRIVKFNSEADLLGKYIDEFHFKITGVFEDNMQVSPREMATDKENKYNSSIYSLAYTIIRPSGVKDLKDMAMLDSFNYQFFLKDMVEKGINGVPNTKSVQKFFVNTLGNLDIGLQENEIIVADNFFVKNYEKQFGKKLSVGDEIELCFAKTSRNSGSCLIEEIIMPYKKFVVKQIVKGSNYQNGTVVFNHKFFENYTKDFTKIADKYAIKSSEVTLGMLQNIRKYAYDEIYAKKMSTSKNDFYHNNCEIEYAMTNYEANQEYNNSIVKIAQLGIALPLFLLSVIAFTIISVVLVSDMVKNKNKEILILKSLGVKNKEITMFFALILIVVICLQILFGLLIGAGVLYGLNVFWAEMNEYTIFIKTFAISAGSVVISLLTLVVLNAMALGINIFRLNDKNLRKAFQKTKE